MSRVDEIQAAIDADRAAVSRAVVVTNAALENEGTWDFFTTEASGIYLVTISAITPGADKSHASFVNVESDGTVRIVAMNQSGGSMVVTSPETNSLRLTNATGETQELIASVMRLN